MRMDLVPFPPRDIRAAADAAKAKFDLESLRLGFLRTDTAIPVPLGVIAWEDNRPASSIMVSEFKGMTTANIEVIGPRGGKHGLMHAHYDSFGTMEIFHSAHGSALWTRPVSKFEHYGKWRRPKRIHAAIICAYEGESGEIKFALRFTQSGCWVYDYSRWSWASLANTSVWEEFKISYPSARVDGYRVNISEADLTMMFLAAET